MNILDVKTETESFSLFVGQSGSGKTAAIASYAKLGPLLLFDLDKRARGILGLRSVLGEECLKNIEVKQYDQSLNFFRELDKDLSTQVDLSRSGKCQYKTIVVESVNTIENCLMNMVDDIGGSGIIPKTIGGIKVYQPTHYKFASVGFRQIRDLRLMQLKGVHVIVSCWVVNRWDKPTIVNEKGNEVKQQYADNVIVGTKLLLTDKLSEEVPGCFDEVFEFYKQEDPRKADKVKHGVRFQSSIAKTTNEKFKKIGDADLTDRCFIDVLDEIKNGTYKSGAVDSNGKESKIK